MGSKSEYFSPIDAEDINPLEPEITLASSDKISPNRLSVNKISNCLGFNIICMAALSTNKHSRVTSGYSAAISVTTFRHKRDVSITLALSTKVTLLRLVCAA